MELGGKGRKKRVWDLGREGGRKRRKRWRRKRSKGLKEGGRKKGEKNQGLGKRGNEEGRWKRNVGLRRGREEGKRANGAREEGARGQRGGEPRASDRFMYSRHLGGSERSEILRQLLTHTNFFSLIFLRITEQVCVSV